VFRAIHKIIPKKFLDGVTLVSEKTCWGYWLICAHRRSAPKSRERAESLG
jgi:hypothetical protein